MILGYPYFWKHPYVFSFCFLTILFHAMYPPLSLEIPTSPQSVQKKLPGGPRCWFFVRFLPSVFRISEGSRTIIPWTTTKNVPAALPQEVLRHTRHMFFDTTCASRVSSVKHCVRRDDQPAQVVKNHWSSFCYVDVFSTSQCRCFIIPPKKHQSLLILSNMLFHDAPGTCVWLWKSFGIFWTQLMSTTVLCPPDFGAILFTSPQIAPLSNCAISMQKCCFNWGVHSPV